MSESVSQRARWKSTSMSESASPTHPPLTCSHFVVLSIAHIIIIRIMADPLLLPTGQGSSVHSPTTSTPVDSGGGDDGGEVASIVDHDLDCRSSTPFLTHISQIDGSGDEEEDDEADKPRRRPSRSLKRRLVSIHTHTHTHMRSNRIESCLIAHSPSLSLSLSPFLIDSVIHFTRRTPHPSRVRVNPIILIRTARASTSTRSVDMNAHTDR